MRSAPLLLPLRQWQRELETSTPGFRNLPRRVARQWLEVWDAADVEGTCLRGAPGVDVKNFFCLLWRQSKNREYWSGKYHCSVDLLFDGFGLVCFANKNKNCQLSYSWFQTSQTRGQWYSDTSPFSIPLQEFVPGRPNHLGLSDTKNLTAVFWVFLIS